MRTTQTGWRMTERQLQAHVEDAARKLGYLTYHTWNSLHSARGFPDLVALRPPRLLFIELKRDGRTATEPQAEWLLGVQCCPGVEAYLWNPQDWHEGRIERVLLERPAAAAF